MADKNGTINGLHLKAAFAWTVAGGLIACGIWIGATDFRQQSTKTALDSHVSIEAHPKAQNRLTTLETHYIYIKRDLAEIKVLLKEMRGFPGPN